MSGRYIAIIDSGIGGISVLEECLKVLPNENYLYFGDNVNAPYGSKTDLDLISLTVKNIEFLKNYNLKAVVFGCNTISTRILHKLQLMYPQITFFGTFPPVEMNLLHRRKTLLLCTPNTAKTYLSNDYLVVVPLPNLAKDIENKIFDIESVDIKNHLLMAISNLSEKNVLTTKVDCLTTQSLKMIIDHQLGYFDVVILGCTHYNFVKSKIFNHFKPPMITGGERITAINLKKFLQKQKSLEKIKKNEVLFVGDYAEHNKKIFQIRNDNSVNFCKIF